MEPELKLRERAERYRQIARNTLDPKVAREIAKIAEDYEHRAMAGAAANENLNRW